MRKQQILNISKEKNNSLEKYVRKNVKPISTCVDYKPNVIWTWKDPELLFKDFDTYMVLMSLKTPKEFILFTKQTQTWTSLAGKMHLHFMY